jgi:hypothetical protein
MTIKSDCTAKGTKVSTVTVPVADDDAFGQDNEVSQAKLNIWSENML